MHVGAIHTKEIVVAIVAPTTLPPAEAILIVPPLDIHEAGGTDLTLPVVVFLGVVPQIDLYAKSATVWVI